MKIREITLGVVNRKHLVYIQRVEKADLVSIPELEWCTIIPDEEGAKGLDDLEALLERLRQSLNRSLSYGDAERLTDKIMEWITERPE
ncbi:YueH family protein [Bacillus cereus]|nr:YueH family protein [Bacillus cereus]